VLLILVLVAACSTAYDSFRPNLCPMMDVRHLPPVRGQEQLLLRVQRPDGILEEQVGWQGRCVYVFEIDPKAHRLVGWRYAAKDDPKECLQEE
jgi:hypothetical protein